MKITKEDSKKLACKDCGEAVEPEPEPVLDHIDNQKHHVLPAEGYDAVGLWGISVQNGPFIRDIKQNDYPMAKHPYAPGYIYTTIEAVRELRQNRIYENERSKTIQSVNVLCETDNWAVLNPDNSRVEDGRRFVKLNNNKSDENYEKPVTVRIYDSSALRTYFQGLTTFVYRDQVKIGELADRKQLENSTTQQTDDLQAALAAHSI